MLRSILFFALFAAVILESESAGQGESDDGSEIRVLPGIIHNNYDSTRVPLPISYVDVKKLPRTFDWRNVGGKSFLTRSLNQHLPSWCGSCWAHGGLSALADRIKIARGAAGVDINFSIQFVLNCGGHIAGSCLGGSAVGVYQFIKEVGFIPYDSCMPYLACSSDLKNGFCDHINTSCSKMNTCRTCNRTGCEEIDIFPNATIDAYGSIRHNVDAMKAEVFMRGPIAATINGKPLHFYRGGIFNDTNASNKTTHVVSIVGWGYDDASDLDYWIIRNSWGEYWGENLGFARIGPISSNVLGIESKVSWAIPASWTEHNYPCYEDGSNCNGDAPLKIRYYIDPSSQKAWLD